MAAESILTYKKPGFPKTDNTEKSYRTTIEYVGPESTLAAAEPAANAVWGDYDGRVTGTNLNPIEGTTQAELTVTCEYFYEANSDGTGSSYEVIYEVEWAMFERSMFEHPVFAKGGGGTYELTSADIAAIESWQQPGNEEAKESYRYKKTSEDGTDAFLDLSASATMFAKGLELGQETYEDYAPVIRKTTKYANGLPPKSEVGLKDNPPTFSGGPTGYQWRKSADRAVQANGQTRWDRVEEWVGAKKILTDRQNIYWS